MGLYLPLRPLAFEDVAGKVWLLYPDPAHAAEEYRILADHPAVVRIQDALPRITDIVVGG